MGITRYSCLSKSSIVLLIGKLKTSRLLNRQKKKPYVKLNQKRSKYYILKKDQDNVLQECSIITGSFTGFYHTTKIRVIAAQVCPVLRAMCWRVSPSAMFLETRLLTVLPRARVGPVDAFPNPTTVDVFLEKTTRL